MKSEIDTLKLNLAHIWSSLSSSKSNLNSNRRKNILRRLELAFLPSFCSPKSIKLLSYFLSTVDAYSSTLISFIYFLFRSYLGLAFVDFAFLGKILAYFCCWASKPSF